MWLIISIVVIIVILRVIGSDHKNHVDTHINRYGGMKEKYKLLINYFESGGLKITRVTGDSIELSTNSAVWYLDYVGNNLEVRMKSIVPVLGKVDKKWIFPDGYPQEKMIEEIDNHMNWLMEQFKRASKNNPY